MFSVSVGMMWRWVTVAHKIWEVLLDHTAINCLTILASTMYSHATAEKKGVDYLKGNAERKTWFINE